MDDQRHADQYTYAFAISVTHAHADPDADADADAHTNPDAHAESNAQRLAQHDYRRGHAHGSNAAPDQDSIAHTQQTSHETPLPQGFDPRDQR
jgi:hypothetical protein